MQFHNILTRAALALAAGALAALSVASAAGASVHAGPATYKVVTYLSARPDSGGNGNWANDTFTRTAKVTLLGSTDDSNCGTTTGSCWAYLASISDTGHFRTIPAAFAPNQGGTDLGSLIGTAARGTFTGYGRFTTFFATALPETSLVPRKVTGSSDPSSLWPELFFPQGTSFQGVNENDWGYSYRTLRSPHQRWADTSYNGGGQAASAGNITS